MNERKYYIDWLRVFAMIGVFVYHCTRFFDPEGWHLKAPAAQQSEILPILRQLFLWQWLMELFFFVAGFAAWYALQKRSGGHFLLERVKRILVPLYTVGLLILMVPQAYFDRFTKGILSSTFWEWLPGYFRGLPGEIVGPHNYLDPIQLLPYGFAGNLWFLLILFMISLVALPDMVMLKSNLGQRFISKLSSWSSKPGGLLLFVIPLACGRLALNWIPVTTDMTWSEFLWYALFFLFGYVIAGDERFTQSIRKQGWLCLGLWLGPFMLVGVLFNVVLKINVDSWNGFSIPYLVWQVIYSLCSWSAVIFWLSVGLKYLNFNNKFLAYSNEAVLPFYILHQTVILVAGWFVLPWQMGGMAKFWIIAAVSFPVILILYEAFIRHFDFMRFLFGMPPQKRALAMPGKMVPTLK